MQTKKDFPRKYLAQKGFEIVIVDLPKGWQKLIEQENWQQLDDEAKKALLPKGLLHEVLTTYLDFSEVEHILALRKGTEDEDGIWHDDGSRNLAFSLSLTKNPEEIVGGELLFRHKNRPRNISSLGPFPMGEMIVFLTGKYGFEHKTNAVSHGTRLVLAGWCTI